MNILLELYLSFFKLGLFTFGGGYAMMPLLEKEVVDEKKWASKEEILDYYAIGQSTPGIIAINTSSFCGYKLKKDLGAVVASLGFISPSIIIISLISSFLTRFSTNPNIAHIFSGIRIAVCALVFYSVVSTVKKTCDSKVKFLVFLLTFIAIAVFSITPMIVVIAVAILGIILGRREHA